MPNNEWNINFVANNQANNIFFEYIDNLPREEENQIPELRENPPTFPDYPGIFVWDQAGMVVNVEDENVQIQDGYHVGYKWFDSHTWDEMRQGYKYFIDWCVSNDIRVTMTGERARYNGYTYSFPYLFKLFVTSRRGYSPLVYLAQPPCWNCGWNDAYPAVTCSNCAVDLYCRSCRNFATDIYTDDNGTHHCNGCQEYCARCDEPIRNGHCENCEDRAYNECHNCHYDYDENEMHYDEANNIWLCNNCFNYRCVECGQSVAEDNIVQNDEGQNVCWPCAGKKENEEFDEDSEMPATRLKIPAIPGRELIRLCGVEIEGAKGEKLEFGEKAGDYLSLKLYEEGLSATHRMMPYHQNPGGNLVHVEKDSSVDWELVVGPINMASSTHVNTLNKTIRLMRKLIREEKIKLDMRGGLHIHVGAEKVAIYNAYNLHKIYMFIEDFFYRLGSAKWPYHRSIPKGGKGTTAKSPVQNNKLEFTRIFSASKYYGLNFENYFKTYITSCRCGARQYGVFEDCTCRLGKCTFEFRLFNTTANTTKIHAYLALCQALVAKAIELPEIKDNDQFPVLDFVAKKKDDLTDEELTILKPAWEERIQFIAEELPLTVEEKQSIYYCVMNSDMSEYITNANILLEREV